MGKKDEVRQRHHRGKPIESADSNEGTTEGATASPAATRSLCGRCLSVSKYLLLVIVVPPFLNYASLIQESKELQPAVGQLYDIGLGQKLFLRCEGKGKPTVIMDAPTGMSSDVWSLILPEIAKVTKVCVYDRAGLGFSDRPPLNTTDEEGELNLNKWKQFTVERMVDDLYRLVTFSSQQLKPFIFVGAELGGMVGRFYAQVYESEISDLVLIDPIVEDLFEHDQGVWADLWFHHLLPYFQAHQMSAALGLTRLALLVRLMTPPLSADGIPQEVILRQKHLLCNPRHLSSVVDEYHFINESMSQLQTLFMMKGFPRNVSVTVLNGNYFDEQLPSALNKAWAKSQQTLVSQIHPTSNHIVINGADHHMLYRQPETIIETIKKLTKQRRLRETIQDTSR